MIKTLAFISSFIILFSQEKEFKTNYYPSGSKKSEGWILDGKMEDYWSFFYKNGNTSSQGAFVKGAKEGYWFFYDETGNKTKEGHYTNNQPSKWWVYYYQNNYENCLYQPDGKTRFCLTYENGSITKAKKYTNDVFLQQWTSIASFKKDNPNITF